MHAITLLHYENVIAAVRMQIITIYNVFFARIFCCDSCLFRSFVNSTNYALKLNLSKMNKLCIISLKKKGREKNRDWMQSVTRNLFGKRMKNMTLNI